MLPAGERRNVKPIIFGRRFVNGGFEHALRKRRIVRVRIRRLPLDKQFKCSRSTRFGKDAARRGSLTYLKADSDDGSRNTRLLKQAQSGLRGLLRRGRGVAAVIIVVRGSAGRRHERAQRQEANAASLSERTRQRKLGLPRRLQPHDRTIAQGVRERSSPAPAFSSDATVRATRMWGTSDPGDSTQHDWTQRDWTQRD